MSKRYAKDRAKERFGPKIEKVTLSEKYFWPRVIAAVVLLIIGGITLGYSCSRMFGVESGWQEISINSTNEINCSGDFTLQYNIGSAGVAAGPESRDLAKAYTQACVDGYAYFDQAIAKINESPNQTVTISKPLYEAFEMLEKYKARYHYLGPIYASYSNLFQSEDDVLAKENDPRYNTQLAEYYQKIAAFASNENQIQLVLCGDNQVKLQVSEEYLAYAKENEITQYIELSYLRNAFVCDYIAQVLIDKGYTQGYLSSHDGYIRYLDDGIYDYETKFLGRDGTKTGKVADLNLKGMSAAVILKDFAVANSDKYSYYQYEDGTVRTPYVSCVDGLDHAAEPYLYVISEKKNCAEMVLSVLPIYMADSLDKEALLALKEQGIYSFLNVDGQVQTNWPK